MSCAPEWRLSAYADGDLAPAEVRALELHLVGCARCRRQVIALRDEARVLRDLVHERLPATAPPATAGRGVALGLPLAVGAFALVSLAGGALVEAMPRELAWIAPNQNIGVAEMLFDLVFTLRRSAAEWFDFAFSLAALASAAGLAYFVADALVRRVRIGGRSVAALLLLAGSFALAPRPAQAAFELRRDEAVVVPADARIDGSLFAAGDSVTIEGVIAGDLIAFGERITIRGTVEGNVFCAGREVELSGTVTGSLHCAGEEVRVEGSVGGNFYGAGDDVNVAPAAKISGDVALAGSDVRLEGELARDLLAAGEDVVIAGRVGRDASLHAQGVALLASAVVAGGLDLHLPAGEEPRIETGAVHGAITRSDLEHSDIEFTPFERFRKARFYLGRLVMLTSAFVVGLILYTLTPGLFGARVETAGRFFGSLGLGFAAMIVIPCALLLLVISVLGIPVAALGGLAMAALFFVGPIVLAAAVGRSVMRPAGASLREFAISLLVGLLLVGVLVSLPGIGGLALAFLIWAGAGLLILHLHELWRARRAARMVELPA
jgi:cytoskeletal protein CcmA (bactofilin family)